VISGQRWISCARPRLVQQSPNSAACLSAACGLRSHSSSYFNFQFSLPSLTRLKLELSKNECDRVYTHPHARMSVCLCVRACHSAGHHAGWFLTARSNRHCSPKVEMVSGDIARVGRDFLPTGHCTVWAVFRRPPCARAGVWWWCPSQLLHQPHNDPPTTHNALYRDSL
jgi:hypothetical protein